MIDPRNSDDRLEIGPLGMFALMELMDEGDSDVFEEWLKKEEIPSVPGAPVEGTSFSRSSEDLTGKL